MNKAKVKTAEQAREKAKDWQIWQAEQTMYMSELVEWQEYFQGLAEQFNLTEEFEENGII